MKKLVTESLVEYESLNENLMSKYLDLNKLDEQDVKNFALDLICKTYESGIIMKYGKSYKFFKYLLDKMSIYDVLDYLRNAASTNFNGNTILLHSQIDPNRYRKTISWERK